MPCHNTPVDPLLSNNYSNCCSGRGSEMPCRFSRCTRGESGGVTGAEVTPVTPSAAPVPRFSAFPLRGLVTVRARVFGARARF